MIKACLKALIDNIPLFVWQAGPDGKYVFFNKSWVEFTGNNREEDIGTQHISSIHPEDADWYRKNYTRAFVQHKPFAAEYRLRRYDGFYCWVCDMSKPYYNSAGKFQGYIGSVHDITARKSYENDLKKAREAAESNNQIKNQFLANMSHEIRTPLNGIIGMIELSLMAELTADQRENLNIARTCGFSLLKIINDILDFSKLEAGKLLIEKTEFNIQTLIDNIIKTHSINVYKKGLDLYCRLQPGLPSILIGDPVRVQQIIDNLISNALKFTESGSITVCLEKNLNSTDDRDDHIELVFSVSDTGIGIAGDKMSFLFKSYSRIAYTDTGKYKGSGLGLAITKQLVETMGGNIWVETEKGKGSTFYFSLGFDIANETVPRQKPHKTVMQEFQGNSSAVEPAKDTGMENNLRFYENAHEQYENRKKALYEISSYIVKLKSAIKKRDPGDIEQMANMIENLSSAINDGPLKSAALKIKLSARRANYHEIDEIAVRLDNEFENCKKITYNY